VEFDEVLNEIVELIVCNDERDSAGQREAARDSAGQCGTARG